MEDQEPKGIYNQLDDAVDNQLSAIDGVSVQRDALTLDIKDEEFIRVANKWINDSQTFYESKYHLKSRRSENEKYLFGRQLEDVKLKDYNAKFVDNIIYEGEAYLKPMALSRLPDITVKPGNDSDVSKAVAADVSKIVTSDIQSRERKRVLGLAFRHLPVYFTGVIKIFWNPEKGADGDYDFKVVHPEYIVVDHTAQTNDPKDMTFVAEVVEYSVKEWIMRFPKKKDEFIQKLHDTGVFSNDLDEKTEAGMNSKVKGWEVWYTWFNDKDDQYERQECVGWFYKDLLLDNMKNPYWDWEGEAQLFRYDKIATQGDMQDAVLSGVYDGFKKNTVFNNFLPYPMKPYIFLGYDQWGKQPLDETSRIEQVLFLQQNVDKRGKQITEMLDRARGKHIFSSDSGLQAEDIEEMDLSDPDEDLLIKGDVAKVHTFIPGEQPSAPMIQNLTDSRERIFDKMGANGPTRGQVDMDSPATNNQLAREGDFSRADDLTDDTINYAAERMANWILQMIKLFYTEDHDVRILGDDGQVVFKQINQDMIQDGMELTITASGTDKLKAEQNAMDMAKLKMIDPLNFYKDMHMSDPKGRTEALMMFMMAPQMYIQKYVNNMNGPSDLALALQSTQMGGSPAGANGVGPQTPPPGGQPQQPGQPQGQQPGGGSPQALQDIMQIQQGTVPPVPNQIDPEYMQTLMQFVDAPNGLRQTLQQFPQIHQQIMQWLKAVQALAAQSQQQPQQGGQQPIPAMGLPPGGQEGGAPAVGPVTQNPTPGNTSQVAINPPTG